MTATIPGSRTERIVPQWKRMPDHAGCRCYKSESKSGLLVAMVGQEPAGRNGELLWHVSISHRDPKGQPDRCPTWDEMKSAKYQLVPADVPMVLIFPRRGAPYVDIYPTCLHLWESQEPGIDSLMF